MAPSSFSSFVSKTHPLLRKAQSWGQEPDGWGEAWEQKRKSMLRRSSSSPNMSQVSITDHDVDELKACLDLGFGFDSSKPNPRLLETLPALHLYYEVVRKRDSCLSRSSSGSITFNADSSNPNSDSDQHFTHLLNPGDDPETKKMKLKQWAQVVACTLR
uniref:Uncharacterized protein n=1 Tax=Kalanchoe fedtschenkoi TaxID=63787 RepID=A0A7N0ZU06_KALFE